MFTIRNTSARQPGPQLPSSGGYVAFAIGFVAVFIAIVAAWITHVVVCIKTSSWFLLLFGLLAPPVGVIHGVGVWLGVF